MPAAILIRRLFVAGWTATALAALWAPVQFSSERTDGVGRLGLLGYREVTVTSQPDERCEAVRRLNGQLVVTYYHSVTLSEKTTWSPRGLIETLAATVLAVGLSWRLWTPPAQATSPIVCCDLNWPNVESESETDLDTPGVRVTALELR